MSAIIVEGMADGAAESGRRTAFMAIPVGDLTLRDVGDMAANLGLTLAEAAPMVPLP